MSLIMLAELLIVESKADQLSLCLPPSLTGPRALIMVGALRGGEGIPSRRGGGKEMRKRENN